MENEREDDQSRLPLSGKPPFLECHSPPRQEEGPSFPPRRHFSRQSEARVDGRKLLLLNWIKIDTELEPTRGEQGLVEQRRVRSRKRWRREFTGAHAHTRDVIPLHVG